MTNKEKIKGLYELKQHLMNYPIELNGHKSLPITLIDYSIEALEKKLKTGRWVRDEDWHYHCDKCGAKAPWSWTDGDGFDRMVTPYCPQCGAEMEKWEDADEEWYVHRDEVYGKVESEE